MYSGLSKERSIQRERLQDEYYEENNLRLESTMEWYGAQTNIPPPSFSPSLVLPGGDTPPCLCVENGWKRSSSGPDWPPDATREQRVASNTHEAIPLNDYQLTE